jgi:hypothetical protein
MEYNLYEEGKFMRIRNLRAIIKFISVLLIVSMMCAISPAFAIGVKDDVQNSNGMFYAYVPCTPNAPVTTYAFAMPKTENIMLSFDVTPLADAVDGHIAFNTANCVMGFSSDRKIDIILGANGYFGAWDYTSNKSVTPIPYTKDQTYHITMSIDIQSSK